MVQSSATTVSAYLARLPPERRKVIAAVRSTIRKHLPKGYKETVGWGMLSYGVPLSRFPDTYNGQPLCYAALAAQKHHYAVYLMCVYGNKALETRLRRQFKAAGKRLDMGKSCVRFKQLDDLPLDAIGEAIASIPMERYIDYYKRVKKLPS